MALNHLSLSHQTQPPTDRVLTFLILYDVFTVMSGFAVFLLVCCPVLDECMLQISNCLSDVSVPGRLLSI